MNATLRRALLAIVPTVLVMTATIWIAIVLAGPMPALLVDADALIVVTIGTMVAMNVAMVLTTTINYRRAWAVFGFGLLWALIGGGLVAFMWFFQGSDAYTFTAAEAATINRAGWIFATATVIVVLTGTVGARLSPQLWPPTPTY